MSFWQNLKGTVSGAASQGAQKFGPKFHEWWHGKNVPPKKKGDPGHVPGRKEQIRWGRSIMFTVFSLLAYVLFMAGMHMLDNTVVLSWLTSWLTRGWNWFFWPSLALYWVEEVAGTDKNGHKILNVWPKGLATFYGAVLVISVFCAVVSLFSGHSLYLQEAQEWFSGEDLNTRIAELEEELKMATEGDENGFVTESDRSPAEISFELQKLRAKRALGSIAGGHVLGFGLRFKYAFAWLWWGLVAWFPTYVFFILLVIPVYGVEAASGLVTVANPFLRFMPGWRRIAKK